VVGLPNPYYDAETFLPHLTGLADKPLRDTFIGKSYYLEGLMHLYARAGLRRQLGLMFPTITRIGFRYFKPDDPWEFYLYRRFRLGTDVTRYLVPPHKWDDVKRDAAECQGEDLPQLLKGYPLHYLALLLVMPYRVTASGLRWLGTYMERQARDKSWSQ
jgi:hypothetical protein